MKITMEIELCKRKKISKTHFVQIGKTVRNN